MKKSVIMLFFICAGIVIGTLLAEVTKDASALSWLSYAMPFGLTSPLVLDLNVVTLTLGLSFNLSVSVIIFILLSALAGYAVIRRRK